MLLYMHLLTKNHCYLTLMCMTLWEIMVPYSDVHVCTKKLWLDITKLGSLTRIISKQRAVGEFWCAWFYKKFKIILHQIWEPDHNNQATSSSAEEHKQHIGYPTKAGEYRSTYDRSSMSSPIAYFLTSANYTSGGEVVLLSHRVISQSWEWGGSFGLACTCTLHFPSFISPPQNPLPKIPLLHASPSLICADGSDGEDGRRSASASREGAASR
jgi:hypothetical protein